MEQNYALQTDELAAIPEEESPQPKSISMIKKLTAGMKGRVVGAKRFQELENFQREVEDLNDDNAIAYMMSTLHKNVETALESDVVQDRNDAQKIIGLEKRMLGLKYECALVTKYKTDETVENPTYGL